MLRTNDLALILIAALVACITPTLRAEDAPAGDQPKHAPAAKPSDMHTEMEAMNKAIRTLNKTIADPKKLDANLAAVNELQLHTVACKGMVPKTAATQPAADKDKFIAEYRKQITEVLKTELELEQQLIAGDNAKAAETVKSLRSLEKEGHKQFQPPDDK